MSQTKAQLVQPVGILTGDGINVSGVITATTFEGDITASTGFTTNATNTNLKVTGVGTFAGAVTAASFSGDGSGLTGVANTAFINAEQLTVVGVVTAATGNVGNLNITKSAAGAGATVGSYTGVTTYYGDGQYLSGVGLSVAPWNYNPDINDTSTPVDTGIGLTFNTKVVAGSGTATLKIVNAGTAGTTVQSWGINSFTQSAVQEITLGALVSDLPLGNTYQLDIPEGFLTDSGGKNYVGTAYTFVTSDAPPPEFTAGAMWGWGTNDRGALGQNNTTNYSSAVQVPGTTWQKLGRTSYYSDHAGCIKSDGTLWMVGKNALGQLGNGATADLSSPVQIPGTNWTSLSTGSSHTMATKDDNTLWAWGYNGAGQLGHNNKTNYSSPKQVPGSWKCDTEGPQMCGAQHSIAVRTNGQLFAWGDNGSGMLGQSSNAQYSSPRQVGAGSQWAFCAADIEKSLAITSSGTLYGWGKNQHGQACADGTVVYRSSPVQIPGTWSHACFGDDQGGGVRTDGTLWAWGNNANGQLGQNDTTNRSSAVQVGSGTDWETDITGIDQGAAVMLAVNTDGELYGMGAWSNYGALGSVPSNTHYSSPTQLFAGTPGFARVACAAPGGPIGTLNRV